MWASARKPKQKTGETKLSGSIINNMLGNAMQAVAHAVKA